MMNNTISEHFAALVAVFEEVVKSLPKNENKEDHARQTV
jgi:hypothetical protein